AGLLTRVPAEKLVRDMLRRLGAVRDTLWLAELTDSMAERNRRAIWGAMNAPRLAPPSTRIACRCRPG
ncbi:MAG: hypothetical protein ACKO51_02855, partial [Alphaproteobacteria bacterium]